VSIELNYLHYIYLVYKCRFWILWSDIQKMRKMSLKIPKGQSESDI